MEDKAWYNSWNILFILFYKSLVNYMSSRCQDFQLWNSACIKTKFDELVQWLVR